MNKNISKKLSNRELIKNNILKGKEYYTHSGNFYVLLHELFDQKNQNQK
jgi:hypothetical protein